MELGKSVTKFNRITSDGNHFEGLNKLNMDPEARAKAGYSGGPQQRNPQKPGQLSRFDGAMVQGFQGQTPSQSIPLTIIYHMLIWLVVWNMTFMTFHILGMSSSQLTILGYNMCSRWLKPPTSNRKSCLCCLYLSYVSHDLFMFSLT
jgi:hypothetical protein